METGPGQCCVTTAAVPQARGRWEGSDGSVTSGDKGGWAEEGLRVRER